jgi:aspartate ammonia-lyase
VEYSISIVTALNPWIGYEQATALAREALESGKRVYDLVLEKGLLSKTQLDAILQPETLTRPQAMPKRE